MTREDNSPWLRPDNRCRSGKKKLLICCLTALCLIVPAARTAAQCPLDGNTFTAGERVTYDLYFKWGLFMPKAGTATLTGQTASYRGQSAWHYRLLYRTSGIVDQAFRVRDTIDGFFTYRHPYQLFSSKRTMEGGYYQIDKADFDYAHGTARVNSQRRSRTEIKADTVFVTTDCVFDVLGALIRIRSMDWKTLKTGDQFPFKVVMGRYFIGAVYTYTGQQIVEHGGARYRTKRFTVDIFDDAFTQSKEAAEVWVGDDDNHLPVKIRAKLKIGAAEACYSSSSGLRYPLGCRFVIRER